MVFKIATGNANGPSSDPMVEINSITFPGGDIYDGVVRES